MVVVWPLLPAARVSVSTGKMEQTWAGRLSGSGWRVVYWEDGSRGERREKWLQWQRAKTWRKDGSATTGSNSGSDSSSNNNNNNNNDNKKHRTRGCKSTGRTRWIHHHGPGLLQQQPASVNRQIHT